MTTPLAVIFIFKPFIFVFKHVLIFFHDTVGTSWGLAIILMTVVIRAALIPLTLKQFRSMAAMQKLQPEIKTLQAKYKGDKQRLNQEMMKFYQENGVNPLASCLPLAAQMPVFISLFYMLRKDLRHQICPDVVAGACGSAANHAAKFFFVPDLTNKATGAVLVVLLILYVGTQLFSGLTMSVSVDKTQRNMMLVLPLVFVPFIISFPSGLIVYWVTTNFWTIVQQYIVRKRIGPMQPVAAPALATAGAGGDAGEGGLMARLRAAAAGPAAAPTPATDAPSNGRGNGSGPSSGTKATAGGSPPPPPRRKKKRSGRRR